MEHIYAFILNNIIIFVLLISIIFIFIIFEIKEHTYSKDSIYPKDVVDLINTNRTIIIDCRTEEEFNKNHIINSINIPEKFLDQNIKKLIKYKKIIIIMHYNNYKAKKVVTILKNLNINNTKYIYNGMNEWIKTNLPIKN